MSNDRNFALNYLNDNQDRYLSDLKAFSSIPSISTDPLAKPAMQQAANWIANRLQQIGMENIQILPTDLHPVVYADHIHALNAPTVLIYGHYDVQPAEPLELWISGAFEPSIRGEHIFARGITDMKGQILTTVNAIEAILRTSGNLPVNVKFMIEGEEEIGSPSLDAFMQSNKTLLACDVALNPDSGMLGPDLPTIVYALRGLANFELRVHGPDHDLHSGVFGGAVLNPAQALCELIAGMHNSDGSVALPGFYQNIPILTPEERAEISRLPINDEWYLENTGAPALWGEQGYTSIERTGARPTLKVNGLLSGFTGVGAKTVLPSWAMAKISCRLVPNQDPTVIYQSLRAYLEAHASKSIRWELTQMAGSPASSSERNSDHIQALVKAMETVWGVRPIFKREGGSVPVVNKFKSILGVEAINTGFGMPGDNAHSPNEKLHLPSWHLGTQAILHFLLNLAEV